MKSRLVVLGSAGLLATALFVGACGGKSAPAAPPPDVPALLTAAGATPSADGTWRLGAGCDVILILSEANIPAYRGDRWVVLTPDGRAGVKITPTADKETQCLAAAAAALRNGK